MTSDGPNNEHTVSLKSVHVYNTAMFIQGLSLKVHALFYMSMYGPTHMWVGVDRCPYPCTVHMHTTHTQTRPQSERDTSTHIHYTTQIHRQMHITQTQIHTVRHRDKHRHII